MKYDVMFIGPASKDENIDYTGKKVVEYGGAAFFGEFSARAAGGNVFVALKMNAEDKEILNAYELDEDHLTILNSTRTTNMRNTYFTADRERRLTECICQADPVLIEEIPDVDCAIYHVAGLLYGDFPNELLKELTAKGKVSADMQAFLRHSEDGKAVFHDWTGKTDYMKYLSYLKVDTAEAEILTGTDDRRKAAQMLYDLGAKEVFISNSEEMLVFDGTDYFTCPVKARNLSGRTGRGDTVFGAYLTRRNKGDSIPEALLFATAAVSMKMEQPGPLRTDVDGVREYIDEFYKD